MCTCTHPFPLNVLKAAADWRNRIETSRGRYIIYMCIRTCSWSVQVCCPGCHWRAARGGSLVRSIHTHTRLSLAILLPLSLEKVLCELSIESEMQWCPHVTLCVYMCCCHVCEFYVCLLSPHTGWDVGVSGTRIQTITLRKLLQMCGIQNHHFTLPFIACLSLEHVAIRTVTSVWLSLSPLCVPFHV